MSDAALREKSGCRATLTLCDVSLRDGVNKNLSWELSPIITEADKKIKYVPIAQLDRAHAS